MGDRVGETLGWLKDALAAKDGSGSSENGSGASEDDADTGERSPRPDDAEKARVDMHAEAAATGPTTVNEATTSSDLDNPLMTLTKRLIEVREVLKQLPPGSSDDMASPPMDALALPALVVIGSQSSGKSSLLEAIVGHSFLPKYVACVSESAMSGM